MEEGLAKSVEYVVLAINAMAVVIILFGTLEAFIADSIIPQASGVPGRPDGKPGCATADGSLPA